MEFKINVEVGVTPQLEQLLKRLTVILAPLEAKVGEGRPIGNLGEVKPAETKKKAKNEPEEVKAKEPEAKKEETAAPTEYTTADVRAAMDRCRKRFEGENYKQDTTSEAYAKYHKPLSVWFKYLAATSGAADELPSSLTAEQRKGFITDCDDTILNDEGNFTVPRLIKAKEAKQ